MNIYDAKRMAQDIMLEHGLHNWTVTIDRAKRRFGQCRYATKQISLSEPLTRVNTEDHVRQTVLHEVAHALVGPGHGHDAIWKSQARRIGVKHAASRSAGEAAPAPIKGTCPNCGGEFGRHRRPSGDRYCGKPQCKRAGGSTYTAENRIVWTRNGRRI